MKIFHKHENTKRFHMYDQEMIANDFKPIKSQEMKTNRYICRIQQKVIYTEANASRTVQFLYCISEKIKLLWRSDVLKHEQVYKIKQTTFAQNVLVLSCRMRIREREREREISWRSGITCICFFWGRGKPMGFAHLYTWSTEFLSSDSEFIYLFFISESHYSHHHLSCCPTRYHGQGKYQTAN